jgi:hypothetical protein
MKPGDLIAAALADGVALRLDGGKLKVIGETAVVNRWLPLIREHKPEIIDALKAGADDTVEPFDREAFEERAGIAEFDGGLSREDAEALAWLEDDRRRCTQCLNLRQGVCSIAKPEAGALVVANRGYRPVNLPLRCLGYTPKANDADQHPGPERWPFLQEQYQ